MGTRQLQGGMGGPTPFLSLLLVGPFLPQQTCVCGGRAPNRKFLGVREMALDVVVGCDTMGPYAGHTLHCDQRTVAASSGHPVLMARSQPDLRDLGSLCDDRDVWRAHVGRRRSRRQEVTGADLTGVTDAHRRPSCVPGRGLAQQFFFFPGGSSSGRETTNRKVGL